MRREEPDGHRPDRRPGRRRRRPGLRDRGGRIQPRPEPRPGEAADRRRRGGRRRRGQVPDVHAPTRSWPRRRRGRSTSTACCPRTRRCPSCSASSSCRGTGTPSCSSTRRRRGSTSSRRPFDFEAVDLLDDLGVKAFKVATYELWHLPLIRDDRLAGQADHLLHRAWPTWPTSRRPSTRSPRPATTAADPAPLRGQLPAAVRGPQPARDRRPCAARSACPWATATTAPGSPPRSWRRRWAPP